jgi:hypothetical protein
MEEEAVSKKLLAAKSVAFVAFIFLVPQYGRGETCAECQRKVQSDVSACIKQLPSEGPFHNGVKFANPGKPTDADLKTAADHREKSQACSNKAREGFANCRQTANCP